MPKYVDGSLDGKNLTALYIFIYIVYICIICRCQCVCDCVLMTILEKVIKLARSLRICIIGYRTYSIDFHIDFLYFFVSF